MLRKNLIVVLRHENSLNIVKAFADDRGFDTVRIPMDPVELPNDMQAATDTLLSAISSCDAVAAGTKVFDPVKDGPSHLAQFLDLLKQNGIGNKPVCLTHLHDITPELEAVIKNSGLNVVCVGNDNLKRDGMSNFGPMILKALGL